MTNTNEFASVLNPNMVIKVNATGQLVLTQKSATDPHKLFVSDVGVLQVKNLRAEVVYATVIAPWGWGRNGTIPAHDPQNPYPSIEGLVSFEGALTYFKTAHGKVLPPSPVYFLAPHWDITIEETPVFPIGTFTFSGEWNDATVHTSTMTADISTNSSDIGRISGHGEDASGRKFALTAEFYYEQILSFSKIYDDNGETFWRFYYPYQAVTYNPLTISGTYESSTGVGHYFYYTMN